MKLQSKARSENEIEFSLSGSSNRLFASKTITIVKPTGLAVDKQAVVDRLWEYIQERSDVSKYMNASLTYNKVECVKTCFEEIQEMASTIKGTLKACYDVAVELDPKFMENFRPGGVLGKMLYNLRREYDQDFNRSEETYKGSSMSADESLSWIAAGLR